MDENITTRERAFLAWLIAEVDSGKTDDITVGETTGGFSIAEYEPNEHPPITPAELEDLKDDGYLKSLSAIEPYKRYGLGRKARSLMRSEQVGNTDETLSGLHHLLVDYFNQDEIDLELTNPLKTPRYDGSWGGNNPEDKAWSFLRYIENKGQLSELRAYVKKARPNLPADELKSAGIDPD